ncbi:RagB/SusD family nutrient uptake outer membrane protein [Echinicola strongylocentroti]|uniref:RagB/SusD family nutrient uptake outer membrane protein n=1 Tax=Echinicola strongylocentroti TaxID=1795355 RepID=A0A2Z4IGQ0_9BACT|nr:RagB/SusD family nutrient uptake outer membrane protein [Echinicola strongylocentroti]AWW30282.1 RagB/SusD family nutrient uptake outer membrane protein [Echinicola strongylocentroti]
MKYATINYFILGILLISFMSSCSDEYLDQPALGALGDDVLANPDGVNKLLIGAYAALDGQGESGTDALGGGSGWEAAPENWIYGTVAGGEASKGSFAGDQPAIDPIVNFYSSPSNGFFNTKWKATYEGIKRTNNVLKLLPNVEELTDSERQDIAGQARFLRGHFYFELKKMFNMVPWIDETTEDPNQPNDQDIWPMIEADFQFAYDNLPPTQSEFARANKWAAAAYLGKTYLYQQKYQEANTIFKEVISSGVNPAGTKYALLDKFADNFDAAKENNAETVFDIQMVANSGTGTISNSNSGNMLNFPYNSPFRCCGFYQPTQNLVNSFKTDPSSGLPFLDNYNQNPVKSDMGITSSQSFEPYTGSLDPRLDWTVGRRGVPYHDWGHHPGQTWVRDQSYGGPYAPKKTIYRQATQDLYADQSSWAPGTAINVHIIRYADVILMCAETEAQLGNLTEAMNLVNQIRTRAMNPDGFLKSYINESAPMDGFTNTPAANYTIEPYTAAQFGSQEDALKAIYFERKLELAMEGHRFFDLVRWGIAEQELNAYFDYQGSITQDVKDGSFSAPKNNYYPIPQRQIDLSVKDGEPMLKQNPGYN